MYYIFYQDYDDMDFYHSDSLEEIDSFMKKNDISREYTVLIEGECLSGMGNKNWPKRKKK